VKGWPCDVDAHGGDMHAAILSEPTFYSVIDRRPNVDYAIACF
jgi:hypothetical protein